MLKNVTKKAPVSYDDIIKELRFEKLEIANEERAKKYFLTIGYSRLKVYSGLHYDNVNHLYKNKFSFDDLLKSYIFDRKLRTLFIEALEIIEIALRNSIAESFSSFLGDTLWIYDPTQFDKDYSKIFSLIQKNVFKSTKKALDIDLVETEISEIVKNLPFGVLAKLYEHLLPVNRDFIANNFNLNNKVMLSWFDVLKNQRNTCAHYDLLWSKIFGVSPISLCMGKEFDMSFGNGANKLFAQFYVTAYFLYLISPSTSWVNKLKKLLDDYTTGNKFITYNIMGFPKEWEKLPLFEKMLKNIV